MKKVAYIILLALLTACTNLEEPLTKGQPLPEGKYPIILGLSVANNSVTTRISDDANGESQWDGGEEVAVRIGGVVKKYVVKKSGSACTLEPATGVTPDYWQSSTETKTIEAWYPYNGGSLPTGVQQDQSGDTNYFNSDILYGKANIAFSSTTKSITMRHQVAKIIVNIKKKTDPTNERRIENISVGGSSLVTGCTYSVPQSGYYGTWNTSSSTVRGSINPHKTNVTNTNAYVATYTAMIIPQTFSDKTSLVTIGLDDGNSYSYKISGSKALQANAVYTYDIDINNTPLINTSNSPTIVNAGSTVMIVGNGSKTTGKITINVEPGKATTVRLENVNIEAKPPIKITGGGTATIILKGQNSLNNTDGPAVHVDGSSTNVIIEGDGSLTASACKGGAGIGGAGKNNCGDITIRNTTINITVNDNSGLVACGAAIGSGGSWRDAPTTCGNIVITNSNIVAQVTTIGYYSRPALIGSGGAYHTSASCGNITITLMQGQTKPGFLSKLTGVYGQQVGKGNGNSNGTTSCGTITWKDSNGSVTETIPPQP